MAYWCLKDVDYDYLEYGLNTSTDAKSEKLKIRSTPTDAISSESCSSPTSENSPQDTYRTLGVALGCGKGNNLSSLESDGDATFPTKTTLSSPRQDARSSSRQYSSLSSPRDEEFITSPRMCSPVAGSKSHYVKFVIPKPCTKLAPQELEDGAINKLRMAMVCRETQRHIPRIIAEWPCSSLRLSRILSPEACIKVFTCVDQLWTHILHGLLIQTPTCRLRCMDLTGFIPSTAMMHTMLQLIPLLSYKSTLDRNAILHQIVKTYDVKDNNLLKNIRQFLDAVICHPVYTRGRKLQHQGPLEIIIDYLPLAADKLSLYCWMMSSSLYDMTNVYIKINTVVFKYTEAGSEFSPIDPLLPLEIFMDSVCVQDVQGVSVTDVPVNVMDRLISVVLPKCAERGYKLKRLALPQLNISVDFTRAQLQSEFSTLLSRCCGLMRLDLSGSCVPGLISKGLFSKSLPLEFLNLSHSCLNKEDLVALFNSSCASTLCDLNISFIYSGNCSTCCQTNDIMYEEDDDNNNSESLKRHLPLNASAVSDGVPFTASHRNDIDLLKFAFQNLHKLKKLKILDISNDRFGTHRIDESSLEVMMFGLRTLPLRRLNIHKIPLWDEDIINVVKTISTIPTICVVTLTRSTETRTLTTEDLFVFWKKVEEAKNAKQMHINVENLVQETLFKRDLDSSLDLHVEGI